MKSSERIEENEKDNVNIVKDSSKYNESTFGIAIYGQEHDKWSS